MDDIYDSEEEIADDTLDGDDQEGDELLALLNGEPEDSDEDDDEDDGLEPEDGDSPEVLRTKLTAKNKIIRQREKAIKRLQKEAGEKQSNTGGVTPEQLAELAWAIKGGGNEDVDTGPDLAKLKEQFEDDPSMIVELLFAQNQQLEQKVANVLRQRDGYFQNLIGETKREEVSPEVKALANRLKSRPEYAEFNDEQLFTVAKTLQPVSKRIGRVPARTSSNGVPMTANERDVEKAFKGPLAAMGYGDDD